jgi:uncharacterized protein YbaP (TraB family)
MRPIRIALLVLLMNSCRAQPGAGNLATSPDGNTLLWEVSGKGTKNPSYLFGTFHLLCKDSIHFSLPLQEALKATGEVYMEMDMDDPSTILGGLLVMNMSGGKKLKDLYSPTEYQRVEQFFRDSLLTGLTLFQQMKPAFLEAMLYPKLLPCRAVSGVEEELVSLSKADKKEIQGLETMAFQASVFDSIPYAEQAKELLKTIDSLDTYRKYFDTMINVYKSQHLKEIETLFSKTEFGLEEHQDLLLNDRNRNWVAQLKTIMKKESVFVAVGAGHLVGEQGLIALLRKEGYVLRPLVNW